MRVTRMFLIQDPLTLPILEKLQGKLFKMQLGESDGKPFIVFESVDEVDTSGIVVKEG